MSKVTIVTISFNQAKYLESAIQSVLSQGYKDLEYIIADGGSSDGSVEIIERYADRLSGFLRGPDRGPADALNQAFGRATGQIYGFLNSDDVLLPGAIQKASAYLSANPAIGFASGHCVVTDALGRPFRKSYSDPFDLRWFAHGACILLQPATFFMSSLFAQTSGFNPANPVSWDAELFFEFGLLGARHGVIDEMLAEYRVHATSITGENRADDVRKRLRDSRLRRYLGREITQIDRWRSRVLQYQRKIVNYRDTWERITRGPIGGQFGS